MRTLFLSALLVALLAGCASEKPKETLAPVEERAPTAPGATTTPIQPPTTGGVNPLKDPSNILSKRGVYFDFDSFVIKDDYKPLVSAHSKYLNDHKSTHITVQGNADERGSSEYNLALGQKRADAVRKMMALYGVPEAQVETISFGKEKPRNSGHDEAAWAENRRADIVYPGEQ